MVKQMNIFEKCYVISIFFFSFIGSILSWIFTGNFVFNLGADPTFYKFAIMSFILLFTTGLTTCTFVIGQEIRGIILDVGGK